MLIGSNHAVENAHELEVVLDDKVLKQPEHFKYLGVNIDNRLRWNNHVSCVSSKVYPIQGNYPSNIGLCMLV